MIFSGYQKSFRIGALETTKNRLKNYQIMIAYSA